MRMRAKPLPTTILAGYLGSGKTTLVNHLLRNAAGQKILVLVNDFGDLPIDEDLIVSEDGSLLTLANGCACCSMGSELYQTFNNALDFDPAPDQLLIEASGVAEPQRIANIAKAEPDLSLNAIVTVVDADNFFVTAKDVRVKDTLFSQVTAANLLLLNKIDLIPNGMRQVLDDELRKINGLAALMQTRHCAVPTDFIFGREGEVFVNNASLCEPGSVIHEDLFERWSIEGKGSVNSDALRRVVSLLPPNVFRMKGLYRDQNNQACVFHKVGQRIEISRYDGTLNHDFKAQFVAIGQCQGELFPLLQPVFKFLLAE